MKFSKDMLKLYAITDRSWVGSRSILDDVEQAILGGVTIVQLREKSLDYDDLLELAIQMKKVCDKYNVLFIINDNVDIAVDCGASGVHIGQSDGDILEARAKLGKDKIIGVTAKTVQQALVAQESGADYLGSGAVFGSTTKLDALPMDMELFTEICNSVSIPVCAIGGITKENMVQLKNTGLSGVALVSTIFAYEDIKSECVQISEVLKDVLV